MRCRAALMRRLLCVFLACASSALPAQVSDSGFAPWHSVQVEAGRSPPPVLLRGTGVQVVLIPVGGHERAVRESNLRANPTLCAGTLNIGGEVIGRLVDRRAWTRLDSTSHERPLITISVAPMPVAAAPCGLEGEPRAADAANGTVFSASSVMPPSVARLAVMVDGESITPILEGASQILLVSAEGSPTGNALQRRALFPPEAFALRADGGTPRVEIHAWMGESAEPVVLTVPPPEVRALWLSAMPWRAARLAGAVKPQTLPVGLPLVNDRVLLRSRQLYRDGNHAVASTEAWARINDNARIPSRESLATLMQLGLTWAAYDDAPAARTAFVGAMRTDPCIVLPESVFSEARDVMDGVRPPEVCVRRSAGEELRRSLVPGRAQRLGPGNRAKAGRAIFIAVATQATIALVGGLYAQHLYAKYESETADSRGAWERAESMRMVANVAIAGTIVTWAGSALEAGYWAERWNRGLDERRDYGARATQAFGPVDASRAVR